MTQAKPNPIELYEAAAKAMQPTVAGIRPNQLTSSTPCTEWSVQALLNHNIRVQAFASNVLSGAPLDPSTMFSVDGPLPAEGAAEALETNTNAVLATLKSMDLQKLVQTPFGAMPAENFIMLPTLDLVIHKWDLATGTGQPTSLDSGLAEACYHVMSHAIAQGRDPRFFGPEITVPISASIQNKLLALSGRKP